MTIIHSVAFNVTLSSKLILSFGSVAPFHSAITELSRSNSVSRWLIKDINDLDVSN